MSVILLIMIPIIPSICQRMIITLLFLEMMVHQLKFDPQNVGRLDQKERNTALILVHLQDFNKVYIRFVDFVYLFDFCTILMHFFLFKSYFLLSSVFCFMIVIISSENFVLFPLLFSLWVVSASIVLLFLVLVILS
jgi:hypothetical protein